jgi:hypothetical protein
LRQRHTVHHLVCLSALVAVIDATGHSALVACFTSPHSPALEAIQIWINQPKDAKPARAK